MAGPRLGWRCAVACVAIVLAAGCQGKTGDGGSSGVPDPGASTPMASTPASGAVRPSAAELGVAPSRPAVSRVAATLPLGGAPSGIVIDPVAGRVLVGECWGQAGDAGGIRVFDLSTHDEVGAVEVGPCPQVAADPYAGVVYAVAGDGAGPGTVAVIGTESLEQVATVDAGTARPDAMAVDVTTGDLYLVQRGVLGGSAPGRLVAIDPSSRAVRGTHAVGAGSTSLTVDPRTGVVVIADPDAGAVQLVDTRTLTAVATLQVIPGMDRLVENEMTFLAGPAWDPATGEVYVTGSPGHPDAGSEPGQSTEQAVDVQPAGLGTSAVYVIDTADAVVSDVVPIEGMLFPGAADPGAGVLYLTGAARVGQPWGVTALDTASHRIVSSVAVPGEGSVAVDPTTGDVWAASADAGASEGRLTIVEAVG